MRKAEMGWIHMWGKPRVLVIGDITQVRQMCDRDLRPGSFDCKRNLLYMSENIIAKQFR